MKDEILQLLDANGLLNTLQDLQADERQAPRIETEAYCDSDDCGDVKVPSRIKDVAKTTVFCPDCDSALLWRRKTNRPPRRIK